MSVIPPGTDAACRSRGGQSQPFSSNGAMVHYRRVPEVGNINLAQAGWKSEMANLFFKINKNLDKPLIIKTAKRETI